MSALLGMTYPTRFFDRKPPRFSSKTDRFQQRLSQAPGDPADHLAAGGHRVDDPAGTVDTDAAAHPYQPEVAIPPDLDGPLSIREHPGIANYLKTGAYNRHARARQVSGFRRKATS